MGNIVNIILQLIGGGAGGLGAGKALPKFSLGKIGDIIAGLVGGIGGGQLAGLLGIGTTAVGATGGAVNLESILASVIGGGVGGGVLTAIVGAIKNAMAKK